MAKGVQAVYAVATLDTKEEETLFLAGQLKQALAASHNEILVKIVDVSTSKANSASNRADASCDEVLSFHPEAQRGQCFNLPSERGAAVTAMSSALVEYLAAEHKQGCVAGVISIGGSGGTALTAPAFRSLPIGVPKIIVSTVASGNTAAYVDTSDLILMPSVVDVAGLNAVLKAVLTNAAWALAGMVNGRVQSALDTAQVAKNSQTQLTVGMTMFGVTTPCVDACRKALEARGFDVLVFHATGTGGRAMERLVRDGYIQAVLDITTTEVADYAVGGVLACESNRFDAMIEKKVPLVISVGALDMVNFGAPSTVPPQFTGRNFVEHNAQVTLMRTTVMENRGFAAFISDKVNQAQGPVRLVLPEKGVSMLDAPGKQFHDPKADAALFESLCSQIQETDKRKIVKAPFHINDPEFATVLVDNFLEIAGISGPATAEVAATSVPISVLTEKKQRDDDDDNFSDVSSVSEISLPRVPSHGRMLRSATMPVQRSLSGAPEMQHGTHPLAAATRLRILESLRATIAAGRPIIGAGAGTGISAKFEEIGGADLIIIYNSGRFRMAGRGSLAGLLPFKDANAVVLEMADEVLPVVSRVPVLAGVCGTDPFRSMATFLNKIIETGFAGVQNFPTVGLYDGHFRQNLEETGMGYGLEVEMIRKARALGLLTTPYTFKPEEARAMAAAGADIVVAHMGLTSAGSIGATSTLTLDQSAVLTQCIADAAKEVNPDVIVLCHGGPLSGPKEAQYVLQRTRGVHGFYGASSMERLPVETAIVENMRSYKSLVIHKDL